MKITQLKKVIEKTVELEVYADYSRRLKTSSIEDFKEKLDNMIFGVNVVSKIDSSSAKKVILRCLNQIKRITVTCKDNKRNILKEIKTRIDKLSEFIDNNDDAKALGLSSKEIIKIINNPEQFSGVVHPPVESSCQITIEEDDAAMEADDENDEDYVDDGEDEEDDDFNEEEYDEEDDDGYDTEKVKCDEIHPNKKTIAKKASLQLLRVVGEEGVTEPLIALEKFITSDLQNKNTVSDEIYKLISKRDEKEQNKLKDTIEGIQKNKTNNPILLRILDSDMDIEVKTAVYEKYKLNKKDDDGKFTQWLTTLLKVPFNKYVSPPTIENGNYKTFFEKAKNTLNNAIYGHDQAKHKILQYLGQYVNNPSSKGFVMGIQGPMGNGKTTLVEHGVSKILNRPFVPIPLGGASDASFLNGHSFTYVGSVPGQIMESIINANVMNPIIYFDELDKISQTDKGVEIMNLLIHLTDPAQNHHFQDRYFGNINFDLSKAIIIFSYNNKANINPILLDRIFEVKTNGFSDVEKLVIAKQHLIPNICKDIGIQSNGNDIRIEDDTIIRLINDYTYEGGVRRLRELLYDIFRDYNLDVLCGEIERPTKRRRGASSVYTLTIDYVVSHCLKHKIPIVQERIHNEPTVGKVNGLYATTGSATGGVIPIHAVYRPSDKYSDVFLTGNLGKVMTESASVAKSVAWNLLSEEQKSKLGETLEKTKSGIHVHCSDGSVEKEGPSAGCALTLVLYSLFTEKPINNNVGVTGEIDLSGNVTAIGGLREKMYGAKRAGCNLVLFPFENVNDYEKIKRECPDLFCDTFTARPVKTIYEAIQHAYI